MTPRQRGLPKSVHTEAHKAFRRLMLEARKRAGLTQQEVAKRLKRSQSFVAKYEGGERRVDVVEFLVIARAVELDPVQALKKLIKQF